jgi:exodeoxyribonuclease-5
MLNPDFILTKIMRQAEGDPIVMFCQKILKDEPIEIGIYGRSRVLRVMDYRKNLLLDYDIIICGKNMTRDNINNHARYDILKRKDGKPQIGDKIICRQNNWEREVDGIYLINGMIGYIDNIDYSTCDGHKVIIDFCPEFLTKGFDSLELDYRYMMASLKEKTEFGISQYNKFEYGYCITAHLSQGSQYSKVLYIDEHFWDREMTKKLRYTAISRAIDSIDIVTSYNGLR